MSGEKFRWKKLNYSATHTHMARRIKEFFCLDVKYMRSAMRKMDGENSARSHFMQ